LYASVWADRHAAATLVDHDGQPDEDLAAFLDIIVPEQGVGLDTFKGIDVRLSAT